MFDTTITNKQGKVLKAVTITSGSNSGLMDKLAISYATDFWAGVWEELLVLKDKLGNTVDQFGTFDPRGEIYPKTSHLLKHLGLSENDPAWPRKLWDLAGLGKVQTPDGETIEQFWSFESARKILEEFIDPVEQGGYGGEIMVLLGDDESIVGMTAYSSTLSEHGRRLSEKRFPGNKLIVPVGGQVENVSVSEFLKDSFSENSKFGIFLDHAVSERCRGQGLGSILFDLRLQKLKSMGTTVLVGRTIITSAAQYFGNYVARGLTPLAADVDNPNKHLFFTNISDLKERSIKK